MEKYDVIVIGGGPAGYTAALYTVRAGLKTLVLEAVAPGGQINETTQIDNFPGFPEGIDGFTLGQKLLAAAERFGAQTKFERVLWAELSGPEKTVGTTGGTYSARAVVVATGARHRHLGLDREEELTGRGVAYCAACDGNFYRGKTVAVVGGGNSAAADALLLSRIAQKVYVIHRRDSLRATKIYHQPLLQAENVEFCWNSVVEQLSGEEKVSGLEIRDTQSWQKRQLDVDGLFISIGRQPATDLFAGQLELDENGYIVANETTRTSLEGVWAAGDVRTKQVRQIVTAAADGAVAAQGIEEYLLQG